jgi:Uma2 family endonuclease
MSTSAVRDRRVTFEEFCVVVPGGQKADLIDGVIYMASPDSIEDNRLNGWLLWVMDAFIEERGLEGLLNFSRVAYRLDEHSSPEPDIGFIGGRKLKFVKKGYVNCAPDAAIEIVSPDSIHRDYVVKRAKYEKAGVREYWIIDPMEEKVTFLRLGADGLFKEVRPRGGVFVSKVLPGFWFDAAWFWKSPLPSKKATLKAILAGPAER